MKWLIPALTLAAFSAFAAEKVVFQENFDSPDALKKWRIDTPANGPKYSIDNGMLSVEHIHAYQKRSYIEIPIPLIKKGKLEFDAIIDPEQINRGDRIGLTLGFYNISTFWHDSCKDWRMYFPEPEAKRLAYFFLEPVGHRRISIVPKHKKVHYCILFDHDADLIEFYVNDMRDPKSARYDMSIWGHDFYQGAYLKIGSFAYAAYPYRTLVDNVKLTEITDEAGAAVKKDNILVFDGMLSVHHPIKKLLKGEKNIRTYNWESTGYNTRTTNNYEFSAFPSFSAIERAKMVIINDAPVIQPALQERVIKAVKNGTHLVILGGLCTLNKGSFQGSPLGAVLPVKLDSKWAIKGAHDKPIKLDAKAGLIPENAEMYYYLDLQAADDAEILATADGGKTLFFSQKKIPVIFQKKLGKGTITVLSATACGPSNEKSFWNTDLVKNLLTGLLAK